MKTATEFQTIKIFATLQDVARLWQKFASYTNSNNAVLRKWLIISFSIFYASKIDAQPISTAQHLTLTSFNDNWGDGFTKINDDLRSFGFQIDYQHVVYGERVAQFTATYSGLTSRFQPTRQRLDEMAFDLRLPVFKIGKFAFADAILGLNSYGNFGGEKVQNGIHRATGVPQLNLQYADFQVQIPKIGAQVWGEIHLGGQNTLIQSRLLLMAKYVQGTEGWRQFKSLFSYDLHNTVGDQLQLSAGWHYQNPLQNDLLKNVQNAENGLFLQYSTRLGVLNYGFTIYPTQNFSTGYLGISLLNWNNRQTVKKIDVTAEFGSLGQQHGFYWRYLLPVQGFPQKLQFDLHYQFWSFPHAVIIDEPIYTGQYNQLSLGGQYTFAEPKTTWQLLPYTSLRLGSKNEYLFYQSPSTSKVHTWSLNIIGEAGFRLKLPANFIHKNCYYGFTANYQYVYTLAQIQKGTPYIVYPFADNLGYVGLGGFVMIDL